MAIVLVVYHSDTGKTRQMAELVAAGASSVEGVSVELASADGLDINRIVECDGVALGSPDYFSYVAGQMKIVFDRLLSHKDELKGKPFVGFGSHGGGAKVLGVIETLAGRVGLSRLREGVLCLNAPVGEAMDECRELGKALAQAVIK